MLVKNGVWMTVVLFNNVHVVIVNFYFNLFNEKILLKLWVPFNRRASFISTSVNTGRESWLQQNVKQMGLATAAETS